MQIAEVLTFSLAEERFSHFVAAAFGAGKETRQTTSISEQTERDEIGSNEVRKQIGIVSSERWTDEKVKR